MGVVNVDPFLVRRIVQEGMHRYGTGYRHGDLTLTYETWRLVVEFALEEAPELARELGVPWP